MREKPQKKFDEIKAHCSSRALKHGAGKDDIALGLEYLAIEVLAQDPDLVDSIVTAGTVSEQNFGDWHVGSSNDGGLDGILFNDDLTKVTLIQAKNYNRPVDADVISEAREFFHRVNEWGNPDFYSRFNEKAEGLLRDIQLDPTQQSIDLYFVTTCTASDTNYKEVAELATDDYRNRGLRISCHFLTQSDLLDLISTAGQSHTANRLKEISLNFGANDFITFNEGPNKALVGLIKGTELAGLYNRRDVKNLLFNANVRAALSTGKVNPQIKKTAKEDPGHFFYFNNGVTATCASFEITGTTIRIKGMQVVNGAQTVAALAAELKNQKQSSDVRVLMRVIETKGDSGFLESITRFQNTQNPVKASDFFSNDPFQIWLATMFDSHSGKNGFPKIWYEHKRGVKSPSAAGRKKLTMEQLALLRYAAIHEPTFTYKLAKNIWDGEDDNKNYWQAFGRNGEEVSLWSADEIAEVGWLVEDWVSLRSVHADQRNKGKPEGKYLGVLARYVTAAKYALIVDLQARGELPTFDVLLQASSDYQKELKRVDKVVRQAVFDEYKSWSEKSANARLNLPQDLATWIKLKDSLLEKYQLDAEFD